MSLFQSPKDFCRAGSSTIPVVVGDVVAVVAVITIAEGDVVTIGGCGTLG